MPSQTRKRSSKRSKDLNEDLKEELKLFKNQGENEDAKQKTFCYAWGWNANGQLGFSPYTDSEEREGVDITRLHDCAAMTECIRAQSDRSIANASFPRRTWLPKSVSSGEIVSISTSYYHTLAADANGTCYSWGGGENGTLGQGYEKLEQIVPRRLIGLSSKKIVQVAAGRYHSLALSNSGRVYAWGSSKDGKLGLGDLVKHNVPGFLNFPKEIKYLSRKKAKVKYIAAAESSSFCIASYRRNNTVFVWGSNNEGVLGHPSQFEKDKDVYVPTESVELARGNPKALWIRREVGVSMSHSGDVFSWGLPQELKGRASITYIDKPDIQQAPYEMGDLSAAFIDAAAGYSHSMAVNARGRLFVWGRTQNHVEKTIAGQDDDLASPVLLPTMIERFNLIDRDGNVTSRRYDDRTVATRMVSVSTFRFHSIAVSADQRVYTWGVNKLNRLGYVNLDTKPHIPTQIRFRTEYRNNAETMRERWSCVGDDPVGDGPVGDDAVSLSLTMPENVATKTDEEDCKMKILALDTGVMHSFVVIGVDNYTKDATTSNDTSVSLLDHFLDDDDETKGTDGEDGDEKKACCKCCCVVS